jgi:predicted choloylglycine hydrolase
MENIFPFLEVKGNHRDLGFAIGQRFKKEIQERIKSRKENIPGYYQYLEKVAPYYQITKKYLPEIVEELEAMSEGSKVPTDDLFFHNCREIYNLFINSSENDHCTTVVSQKNNSILVGHNEDWILEGIEDLYILKANLGKTTILGLANNTLLPGDVAMANSHGLVQCINELNSESDLGVPKNFVARAVLDCENIEEATNLIKSLPLASGFNHVLVQKDKIVNIEMSASQISIDQINQNSFVHTNHFLSPKLKQIETFRSKSSEIRYKRARNLLKNNSHKIKSITNLLSDTSDGIHSICRDETIASLVFSPNKNEVWICPGPPDKGKYLKYLF